jgi:hypothetical protein
LAASDDYLGDEERVKHCAAAVGMSLSAEDLLSVGEYEIVERIGAGRSPIPGSGMLPGQGAGQQPGSGGGLGRQQAGTGTAPYNKQKTVPFQASSTHVANQQFGKDGESSVKTIEGQPHTETAREERKQAAMDFIKAEEDALDEEPLPLSRREQVLRLLTHVPIAEPLTRYAASLILATHPESDKAIESVSRFVSYGASPRGLQSLVRGAKVHCLLGGRTAVSAEDIRRVALQTFAIV